MRRKIPLRLDRRAEREIEQATEYYEAERSGLGALFHAALHATLDRIAAFPDSFATVMTTRGGRRVRRGLVHPFSYMVVYVELPNSLRVVAVAHVKRRPAYWRRRLPRD